MDRLKEIIPCLPENVVDAVCKLNCEHITEIRLRAFGLQTILFDGRELVISDKACAVEVCKNQLILDENDLEKVVFKLCSGSVYAYSEQLKQGFVTKGGVRVGVGGTGVIKNGAPFGFSRYSSLNIRFPHHVEKCADVLMSQMAEKGSAYIGGVLVISPPGGGKTTFLRSLAARLSCGFSDGGRLCRKKVCVIDERAEIYIKEVFYKSCADFLTFMPKAYSIELATRVLSPEYIVCDEIGNENDADAIYVGATKGVTFIASCHGQGLSDVLSKQTMRKLFDNRVFSTACELSFCNGKYCCSVKRFSDGKIC